MADNKDVYYFSHDSNARNDEKILMLRAEHGWEGYGLYWALIEMMFEATDTSLYHSKIKGLAMSYNIDITVLQCVINSAITEGLFVSDGEKFWSESLIKRKAVFHESRQKKSDAGKKGMAVRWGSDNTVITSNNTVITENNKGKEKKGKKVKDSNKKLPLEKSDILLFGSVGNVKLTQEEYDKLDKEYPNMIQEAIELLSLHIAEKGDKSKAETHIFTLKKWVFDAVIERRSRRDKANGIYNNPTTNQRGFRKEEEGAFQL